MNGVVPAWENEGTGNCSITINSVTHANNGYWKVNKNLFCTTGYQTANYIFQPHCISSFLLVFMTCFQCVLDTNLDGSGDQSEGNVRLTVAKPANVEFDTVWGTLEVSEGNISQTF